ncbi:MAG: DUF1573 domain-containing protein [Marinilabiliaceae bacterium]|mgnify:FL=1|nr:DUF1573 domain-containing protein [Marinilabiliaceae bacterium]
MKKIITIVIALMASLSVGAQKSVITFSETVHDFGEIQEDGGNVKCEFLFENTGDRPLVLHNVQASCGCTTPVWPRTPIQPGAKDRIEVSFNPQNRPGVFSKTITIQSNAENNTVQLRISGKVLEKAKTMEDIYPTLFGSMRLSDSHIPFTKVAPGETKLGELKVINPSDKPVSPQFINVPAHVKIACIPETLKPGEEGSIQARYDASLKNDWGYVTDQIYVIFDGVKDYKNRITLSASITEDFSQMTDEQKQNAPVVEFNETTHDFGAINQSTNQECDFIITNKGNENLIIRKVKASCGCTAVAPEKTVLAKDESTKIHVSFDPRGKSGRQNKTITVITNDPNKSNVMLRIVGNIEVPGAGAVK